MVLCENLKAKESISSPKKLDPMDAINHDDGGFDSKYEACMVRQSFHLKRKQSLKK